MNIDQGLTNFVFNNSWPNKLFAGQLIMSNTNSCCKLTITNFDKCFFFY